MWSRKSRYGAIVVDAPIATNVSTPASASASTSDDEFSAMGITYQVSDDLTIGYTSSERDFGDKAQDQEARKPKGHRKCYYGDSDQVWMRD